MHLVIDIGNSLVKTAIFQGSEMRFNQISSDFTEELFNALGKSWKITAAIISSVRRDDQYRQILSDADFPCIFLDSTTPVPVTNLYESPHTLGMDRLAAAIGAKEIVPGEDVLVICAGTCLTFDIISKHNEYLGGSISPGLGMRLKALNHFTGKLPLEAPGDENFPLTGKNTRESILSGVVNGILAETDGMIDRYKNEHPGLSVILSGGDLFFFDKILKNRIFAIQNIVLYGLNKILEHNVHK